MVASCIFSFSFLLRYMRKVRGKVCGTIPPGMLHHGAVGDADCGKGSGKVSEWGLRRMYLIEQE